MPVLLRRALITAASFTVLLAVSGVALAGAAYEHFNHQITRVAVLRPNDTAIRNAPAQIDAQNFLLIGSDTRAGADAGYGQDVEGARSDTTILVHLSRDVNHVSVVSFPRDAWVNIPQCTDSSGQVHPARQDMFNSAFTEGGAACTVALVQQMTGIEITHYVQVDFVGFKSMVNALGSVSICSPQAVDDPGSGLRLQPGMNQLNGDQALAYVRARETIGDGSDLGRIKRQQLFLGAVLRQAMSGHLLSDPARLTSFLDAATKAVTVDNATSFSDLRTLAGAMQGLNPARVTFYTAPIADANYSPPGTDETGRVLLDDNAGRVLYDSIIADAAAPAPATISAPAGGSSGAATPTPTPTPTSAGSMTPSGLSAADTSCQL